MAEQYLPALLCLLRLLIPMAKPPSEFSLIWLAELARRSWPAAAAQHTRIRQPIMDENSAVLMVCKKTFEIKQKKLLLRNCGRGGGEGADQEYTHTKNAGLL